MLMVSDMLEVARGSARAEEVTNKAPARFEREQAPVVVWNVCRHCNMTCPHCYLAAGVRPSSSDLTSTEALRVLDDLAAYGVRVVIFSGGEPLLRDDLFTLIGHAQKLGISPQLSTNGVLIDAAVAQRLADHGVKYVGISIDGERDWNDTYRGLVGGYDRALAGLRHARAAGMRTGLRMTLTRANAHDLPAMLAVACAEVDRFYVSHLVYAGRGRKMKGDDLSREDTRALLLRLFAEAERMLEAGATTRIVAGSNDSDGVLLVHWLAEHYGTDAARRVEAILRQRGGNSAGEKLVCIDHRGAVHPDQFWRGAVLGQVPQQTFADVMKHPLRDQLKRRTDLLTGRCAGCEWKALCRGSHRERALAVGGSLWASDPACVMSDAEIATTALPGDARGAA